MRDNVTKAEQNCRRSVACGLTMGVQNGCNTARHREDEPLDVLLGYGKTYVFHTMPQLIKCSWGRSLA